MCKQKFLIWKILKTYHSNTTNTWLIIVILFVEIGASSCRYLGDIDPQNFRCHKDAVKLKKIPLECTALVFDGVTCNDEFVIYPSYDKTDIGNN